MSKRPAYLTVIALFLITWGGVWLIVDAVHLFGNPSLRQGFSLSHRMLIQYINAYLFLAVSVIGGFGLLRGYRWTRSLFVVYGIIHYIIIFMNCPFSLILTANSMIAIAVFFIISLALFLPERRKHAEGAPNDKTVSNNDLKWYENKPLGICISLFPILYVFLLTVSGSSFPFDILQFNLERLLFEGVPFGHVLVILVCSIPATIFFYRRLEKRYRNVVFLLIIGLVVAILYFIALYLFTVLFLIGMFRIFGPM